MKNFYAALLFMVASAAQIMGAELPLAVRGFQLEAQIIADLSAKGTIARQVEYLTEAVGDGRYLKEGGAVANAKHASAILLLGHLARSSDVAAISVLAGQVGWFNRENKSYPAMFVLVNDVRDAAVDPLLKIVVERGNRRISAEELAVDPTVWKAVEALARIKAGSYQRFCDDLQDKVPPLVYENLLRLSLH